VREDVLILLVLLCLERDFGRLGEPLALPVEAPLHGPRKDALELFFELPGQLGVALTGGNHHLPRHDLDPAPDAFVGPAHLGLVVRRDDQFPCLNHSGAFKDLMAQYSPHQSPDLPPT
jgi:hypothetical protein